MPNSGSTTKSSAPDTPRKLLFIINPNAGKKTASVIVKIIRKEFPGNIDYQIMIWKKKDHFNEISSLIKSGDFTDAIAVGGDGTVNKVASALVGTNIRLGIVPAGSGNGLARSLGLSMNVTLVIKQILEGKTGVIDSGIINEEFFFCTSGVGFDAHIAWLFGQSKSRGLKNYARITILQLLKYRAQDYTLELNGQSLRRKAFLITVANAGQYGNDVYVAPKAKLDDGLFHVVIVKPFSILLLPWIFVRVLLKKEQKKSIAEIYTTDQLVITRAATDSIHFDGEPHIAGTKLHYSIRKNSLHAIVGPGY